MANALFTKFKEHLLAGDLDLLTMDIKVVGVDHADDIPVPATDEYLSDILAAARVCTTANLANKSVTNGVFDADDTQFTTATGDPFESLVIYQDSGDPDTSILIAYIDTGLGLPFTPAGIDIPIYWSNGDGKIFEL